MIKPVGFGENVSNKLKGREVTWGHKLGGRDTPRTVLRKPLIQMDKDGEIIKEWENDGTLLASYIKEDSAGIYLVILANDKSDADNKLSTLPYYPYMKIEIIALR